ncbi:MAG: putative ATP-grasp superfamily ATP-dependent carboligase [Paraglaciecola sp.]|jgi:predicted ATP-grasp superfamily ATP-dependent carboligase
MKKIYVIHENEDWVLPLRAAFNQLNLPYEEWFVDNLTLDLNSIPPEGIFYNRMSASAHTRDHRFAPEFTANILAWLERHGRIVINGRRALQLELRKSEQYLALQELNIAYPKTIIANNIELLPKAAGQLNEFPFILKPNRGGKGAGVQLFHSLKSLQQTIDNQQIGESLDGIWLVQSYVKPATGRIVRAEFVGGKFLYAVSIDASKGFELCPADACQISDAHCPVGHSENTSKFVILDDYENEDLEKYAQFLTANHIGIGALEYAEDEAGNRFVYDVNTNTNYNSGAETVFGNHRQGMLEIARFLGGELKAEVVREFEVLQVAF